LFRAAESAPPRKEAPLSKERDSTVLAYLLKKEGTLYYADLIDLGPDHMVFELTSDASHRKAFGLSPYQDSRDFEVNGIEIVTVLSPPSDLLS